MQDNNTFKVEHKVWLPLNKERLRGTEIWAPFKVLEVVGNNAYGLGLLPYMHIYTGECQISETLWVIHA